MHRLRLYAGFAAALIVGTALVCSPPLERASAQGQTLAQAKKPQVRKSAPKKSGNAAPKEQVRTAFTAEDQEAAVVPGIPDARAWGDAETAFARFLPQASGPWLAASGGGSDGAFGAGVLTGWSESGNRPEFSVVTGVSIGALLAPFAFLGPRYDEEVRKTFTEISAADIFEDRKTRDSLVDYWPLRRQIESHVTPQLLSEIAAEHARGRRLFVATTNLDAGRRVVWNMGAIAARGDDKALKLFRDVLLASCSIPGFFSPVGIEVEANGKKFEELHNDGTLTAPFFVAPESMLSAGATSPVPFDQLYVIVNSRLSHELDMPDRSLVGVLGRSIAVALVAALRTEIALISAGARRHGFGLRVAHVDAGFNHPQHGLFDGKYMRALYAHGVAAGKNGTAFEDPLANVSLRGSTKAQ